MSDAAGVVEMDPLTSAVVAAECHANDKGWHRPPKLYALARKDALTLVEGLAQVRHAAPDSLIPIEQDPLPEGDPADVLASIHWQDEVVGCVLVTELVVLPADAEQQVPHDRTEAEQWASSHPAGRQARLSVGVSREGLYACCLRLRGAEELQVGPDLADDLVTALLGTFI